MKTFYIYPSMKYYSVLLLLFAIVLNSCSKKEGEGALLPEDEIPEDIGVLSGTISEALILENRFTDPQTVDYKIPVSLTIAAKVTIKPGVRIEMGPNAKITVTSNGSIRSLGKADSNVVITGRQQNPGYWDYILIHSYDSQNLLRHTVVEYGGGNMSNPGMVILNSTAMLNIDNSTLRYSERYGLYVKDRTSRLPNFSYNHIENCGMAPVFIRSTHIKYIDSTTTLSQGNAFNHIEVDGAHVYEVESWRRTDVPFYLTGATEISSDVKIKPGARFIFGPAGRILVKETGSIYAAGTETDSIYFSGAQEIAGYWDCILFLSNNPYNQFKYVSIKHGGGYYYWNGSIYLHGAFFRISHSTVAHSARWGIYRNGIYNFENGGFNDFYGNVIGNIGP